MNRQEIKEVILKTLKEDFKRKGVNFCFKTRRLARRLELPVHSVGSAISEIVSKGGPIKIYSHSEVNRIWETFFKK